MNKKIKLWGITTNNLKDISVELEPNSINLIIGPSGSGKSSLAYDTIAQIGQHEFFSMFVDNISEPSYHVKGYENMLASVPLKQSNFNTNPRSTIGTYFGINRNIILIYSSILGLSEDKFVLNKEENLCDNCHGLGTVQILDENKIINYGTAIFHNPIRCWSRYKDFYAQILQQFCLDNNIDINKNFRQLSNREKELILFGESSKKYSIRYKKSSGFSRRTTKYYGIMTEKAMLPGFVPSSQFFSERACPCCHGKKYSSEYNQYKISGLSIGDLMTMPFTQLGLVLNQMVSSITEPGLLFAMANISLFVENALKLNLGHLSLHRSIPTLSGGELQRLRMIRVLNTQLSNLLIVLDEPLAGLSGEEKNSVLHLIIDLSKRHTLLVVDHGTSLINISKKIIALGKEGGKRGGFVVDTQSYLREQSISKKINISPCSSTLNIKIFNEIYSYSGVDVMLGTNCLNLITGSSGVGKSTLLREYFPQFFDRYTYIDQKPLVGNKGSCVATLLNISVPISKLFSKKFNKDRLFFSNQVGCDGMCPSCMGAGHLEYGNGYDTKFKILCKECDGTGFNKILKKYKIGQKNVFDIWNMTIAEASNYFIEFDKAIANNLERASFLLLGHLRLGQASSTLSGGENIRIKLLKSVKSSSTILGIDEPFKGLNNVEIYHVAQYLSILQKNKRTIVVVDHSDNIASYFANHIELVCIDGILQNKH